MTHALNDETIALADALRRDADRAALFFDIDGVLAPVVSHAADARVPDEALALLSELVGRYRLVGAVSGRGLADVDRMVPVPGIARGGNHGLEIAGPGATPHLVPQARGRVETLREFVAGLTPDVLSPHGIWMEDKGASVSLHHREAPDQDEATTFLGGEIAPAAIAAGLRTRDGKMILEILPDVDVDKGSAIRALVTESAAHVVLYVGDDWTDVDAWRAMRAMRDEGVIDAAHCVVAASHEVDPGVRAAADMAIPGTEGALALLRELVR